MKGFSLFRNGAVILLIFGLLFTIIEDKAWFLLWLSQYRNVVTDYYFYYVTKLGEPYSFVACGLLLWLSSWKKMITVPLVGVLVIMTSYSLKLYFHFERPSLYLSRIGYQGPMAVLNYPLLTGLNGFPSGHSMAAWALFTLMAALLKRTWVSLVCLFLAVSVSISRIYLLAHFLEDVVAGAMIGVALGYGVYFIYDKWIRTK